MSHEDKVVSDIILRSRQQLLLGLDLPVETAQSIVYKEYRAAVEDGRHKLVQIVRAHRGYSFIVGKYMPFIRAFVLRNYTGYLRHPVIGSMIDKDELIQEAALGFTEALIQFDPAIKPPTQRHMLNRATIRMRSVLRPIIAKARRHSSTIGHPTQILFSNSQDNDFLGGDTQNPKDSALNMRDESVFSDPEFMLFARSTLEATEKYISEQSPLRKAILQSLMAGYQQQEVAVMNDVSKQYVSQVLASAERALS